jgi:hypothetical protein
MHPTPAPALCRVGSTHPHPLSLTHVPSAGACRPAPRRAAPTSKAQPHRWRRGILRRRREALQLRDELGRSTVATTSGAGTRGPLVGGASRQPRAKAATCGPLKSCEIYSAPTLASRVARPPASVIRHRLFPPAHSNHPWARFARRTSPPPPQPHLPWAILRWPAR